MLYPSSKELGALTTDVAGRFATAVDIDLLVRGRDAARTGARLTASSGRAACSTDTARLTVALRALPAARRAAERAAAERAEQRTEQADYPPRLPSGSSGPSSTATGPGASTPPSGSGARSTTPARSGHGHRGSGAPTSRPTGSAPTSGPPPPARTSPSTPASIESPSNLGLPTSFIVAIAVLLLLAGGAAVAFLTRRGD